MPVAGPSIVSGGIAPTRHAGWLRRTAESLFSVLFPSDCRLCGLSLLNISRLAVCPDCPGLIEPIRRKVCSLCSERVLSSDGARRDQTLPSARLAAMGARYSGPHSRYSFADRTDQPPAPRESAWSFLGCACRGNHWQRCVLVDDVYATGTTASACARVLRRAGAAKVFVATVARTLKLASKTEGFKVSRFQSFRVSKMA